MDNFTLTWATTNNKETCVLDEQPICTYSGNRKAIFHLHYLLVRELDKKFVTVRIVWVKL